ncbi:MAG: DUF3185 family protein [Wenzhouxiangellaceae bacterium]|nr:DUF3185 family protein [Wenzhouxiangellaceae bacterium]
MSTNKIIGLILLVIGLVLMYMGYQSSQGLDDQFSEAVTGNYTNETIIYFVLGGVGVIAGIAMLRRKP